MFLNLLTGPSVVYTIAALGIVGLYTGGGA